MSNSGQIVIRRYGGLLSIEQLTPELKRVLENALSYTRRISVRGREARLLGSNVKLKHIECYEYSGTPEEGNVTLHTASGWLSKIKEILRAAGQEFRVLNVGPKADAEILTPRWDLVADREWRWKQKWVLNQILSKQYGRISCPPGYGKGFLIGALAKLLPKATMAITTHAVDVVEQLYFDIARSVPRVGLVSGKTKRPGRRITCYSGKSLHRCTKPVDILIVDEVHEFATDHYFEKLANPSFHFSRRFGFSANHGDRQDKADFELEGYFGNLIANISYQDAVAHGCVAPLEVHWRNVVLDLDPCYGVSGSDVEFARAGVWQNEVRNAMIRDDARSFGDDEQVLISVTVIEHAVFLKKLLPEFTLCYSEAGLDPEYRQWCIRHNLIGRDEPQMSSERRQTLKRDFEQGKLKKVIATTVWKRGVDFRRLGVLIRGDAQASRIADTQIPGRTSRIFEGKEFGLIIDYKDQFNSVLRRRALERRKSYDSFGWKNVDPSTAANRQLRFA